MAKNKIKLTICRTCIRDNEGEGVFSQIDLVEKAYKERLKEGLFHSAAEIKLQNCFSQCENFHCIEVADQTKTYQLKKISNIEKVESVCDFIKKSKTSGQLEFPEELRDNLLEIKS
jgi:hypothetical protein